MDEVLCKPETEMNTSSGKVQKLGFGKEKVRTLERLKQNETASKGATTS
jgi:hypothetical protein